MAMERWKSFLRPQTRTGRLALWLGSAVALWGVALGLVAPPIFRNMAEKELSRNLGSACSLARVRINPFTLRLAAEGLRIPLPDGAECFGLERFEVRLSPATLLRWAPVLTDLRLIHPRLKLTLRRDGVLSVTDLAPFAKKAAAAAKEERPVAEGGEKKAGLDLFGVVVTDLEIRGGALHFRDDIHGADHTLADLSFSVPFTSTLSHHRDRPITPFLEAVVNGKPLRLEGELTPFAERTRHAFQLRLDGLDLPHFQPYVAASGFPILVEKGVLHCAARLEMNGGSLFLKEGEIRVRELALSRNEAPQPFFRLGELALEGIEIDVGQRLLDIRRLLIAAPRLQLHRDRNGVIDLQQLAGAPSAPETASPTGAPTPTPAWRARLGEIALQEGQLAATLEAPRETETVRIQNLSGKITGFDTAPGSEVGILFSGQGVKGGNLALEGKGPLSPLALALRLRVDGLNLQPLSPLFGALSPDLRLGAGTLGLDLESVLQSGPEVTAAQVKGELALEHLSLVDVRSEFAALRTLRIEGLDIDTGKQRYGAGAITLVRPRLNLIVAKGGASNLDRLFGTGPQAAETTPPSPAPARSESPKVRLARMEISDGMLLIRDEQYTPPLVNRLEKITGTVRNLESAPDSRARLAFSAVLNGAPVTAEGRLNPLRAEAVADLTAGLNAFNLSSLSPLSERFIAYPLTKGVFSLDSRIQIEEGRLDSRHHIRLDGLELGDKVEAPEAPNLPVKLGVSLLQDPAGNIDLTLPVHGDLRDPSFSVGGLVFKVIANLLLKAATSPFTLLAGMMGVEGQGLEYVSFEPGEGRLFAKDAKGLPTVAGMLMSRPKIHLMLIPHADEKDRRMLADAFVLRRLQELKHAALPQAERAALQPRMLRVGPEVDADEYRKLLFEVYKEQPFQKPTNLVGMVRELPPGEMLEKIREFYPKDDAALKKLAGERGQEVRAAFVALQPELEKRIGIDPPQLSQGEGQKVGFGIQ
ncbi:MAG: DUF748 domain-containing protein [Deltaproteobacteria bacterium]|nr:DUF748 domain-containing protein [Deltaproteobacteria bacterium]